MEFLKENEKVEPGFSSTFSRSTVICFTLSQCGNISKLGSIYYPQVKKGHEGGRDLREDYHNSHLRVSSSVGGAR